MRVHLGFVAAALLCFIDGALCKPGPMPTEQLPQQPSSPLIDPQTPETKPQHNRQTVSAHTQRENGNSKEIPSRTSNAGRNTKPGSATQESHLKSAPHVKSPAESTSPESSGFVEKAKQKTWKSKQETKGHLGTDGKGRSPREIPPVHNSDVESKKVRIPLEVLNGVFNSRFLPDENENGYASLDDILRALMGEEGQQASEDDQKSAPTAEDEQPTLKRRRRSFYDPQFYDLQTYPPFQYYRQLDMPVYYDLGASHTSSDFGKPNPLPGVFGKGCGCSSGGSGAPSEPAFGPSFGSASNPAAFVETLALDELKMGERTVRNPRLEYSRTYPDAKVLTIPEFVDKDEDEEEEAEARLHKDPAGGGDGKGSGISNDESTSSDVENRTLVLVENIIDVFKRIYKKVLVSILSLVIKIKQMLGCPAKMLSQLLFQKNYLGI